MLRKEELGTKEEENRDDLSKRIPVQNSDAFPLPFTCQKD